MHLNKFSLLILIMSISILFFVYELLVRLVYSYYEYYVVENFFLPFLIEIFYVVYSSFQKASFFYISIMLN